MTPRPLHRWKTFWLGLLAACFIGWAAWDSTVFYSHAGLRQFRVENAGGGISIRLTDTSYTSVFAGSLQWDRFDMKRFAGMFPNTTPTFFVAPFFLRGEDRIMERDDSEELKLDSSSYHAFLRDFMPYELKENWRFFIPHWLLLLVFVAPWSAFLIWRVRRQRKLTP